MLFSGVAFFGVLVGFFEEGVLGERPEFVLGGHVVDRFKLEGPLVSGVALERDFGVEVGIAAMSDGIHHGCALEAAGVVVSFVENAEEGHPALNAVVRFAVSLDLLFAVLFLAARDATEQFGLEGELDDVAFAKGFVRSALRLDQTLGEEGVVECFYVVVPVGDQVIERYKVRFLGLDDLLHAALYSFDTDAVVLRLTGQLVLDAFQVLDVVADNLDGLSVHPAEVPVHAFFGFVAPLFQSLLDTFQSSKRFIATSVARLFKFFYSGAEFVF